VLSPALPFAEARQRLHAQGFSHVVSVFELPREFDMLPFGPIEARDELTARSDRIREVEGLVAHDPELLDHLRAHLRFRLDLDPGVLPPPTALAYFPPEMLAVLPDRPRETVALDDLLEPAADVYVKLDIEGAEAAALAGARELIARAAPLLAITVYHRPAGLWEFPSFLVSLQPRYRIFLRTHGVDGTDVLCYAIPE
jgi:hypothetical protein